MSDAFVSEIRLFPWNWAPRNWALCDGSLILIQSNTALFSLLGTTYGGNGSSTFGLPDLRGRVAVNQNQGPGLSYYSLGEQSGTEGVTLLSTQMPQHTHLWTASSGDATQNPPLNGYLGKVNRTGIGYLNGFAAPGGTPVVLGNTLSSVGSNQPHSNLAPSLTLNYCICTVGIFPSRN